MFWLPFSVGNISQQLVQMWIITFQKWMQLLGWWEGRPQQSKERNSICVLQGQVTSFILGPVCCNTEMQVADCSIVLSLPFLSGFTDLCFCFFFPYDIISYSNMGLCEALCIWVRTGSTLANMIPLKRDSIASAPIKWRGVNINKPSKERDKIRYPQWPHRH